MLYLGAFDSLDLFFRLASLLCVCIDFLGPDWLVDVTLSDVVL